MKPFLALTTSILLGIIGQLTLKAAAIYGSQTGNLYFQKYTILGLFTYFLAALLYIYALKVIPLSIAFPSVSISYVAVAYGAHLIWGDPFGAKHISALLCIGAGLYILSRN